MMRNRCRSLVYVVIVIFFFASTVQCRVHPLELAAASNHGAVHGVLNNTSHNRSTPVLDESKVALLFCLNMKIDGVDSYCCINEKPIPYCYKTLDICQQKCPVCTPKCPPAIARPL
ncbi:hypothetical protein EJB05_26210 [Eragrostis curvula]|uniref:4Fe-4S ferredoxin-type domain-containing protein n=1 Tax=Eragrostis curvula TaxID=38414 RepID=A0A5J9UKN8_9POAL|nr:hypothetical protein EJB05_26210 [Eragrostis curvula]